MTIIRRIKNENNPYVMISRYALQDKRLSWEARGVLAYLLSQPDDWQISTTELINSGCSGKDAMYRILKEIETAGYLQRHCHRNHGGKFVWEKHLHEYPVRKPNKPSPFPGLPETVQPETVQPETVQPETVQPETVKPEVYKRIGRTNGAALPLAPGDVWKQYIDNEGLSAENVAYIATELDKHIPPTAINEWSDFLVQYSSKLLIDDVEALVSTFATVQLDGWIDDE